MKTKLYVVVLILFLILLFPKPKTFYSGTYYAGNTNEELVLNPNNSFIIRITRYENSTNIKGKYLISNNHIKLLTNYKKDTFLINNISSGEVTGTTITFKHDKSNSSTIFTKS
jgi:hypothetical protein